MEIWRGYIAVERFTSNLNETNWVTLIDELESLQGVDSDNKAHNKLAGRGNLDTFNYGTAEDPDYYSNLYIYEAQFNEDAISFDKFQTRLVNLFGVNPEDVTYTVGTSVIRNRLSCFATYQYNTVNRIRVGLFGCESDSVLCTWGQSRSECVGYLIDNSATWESAE